MIALCTDEPDIDFDGPDRLILTVPSGSDVLRIALTRYQARILCERGLLRLEEQSALDQAIRSAEVVPLKTPRRKARGS